MYFVCSQQALSKALGTVDKAVSTRTTIPVLKGILLKVLNNKLFLTASDMDLSIETAVDTSSCEEGETVVNAKLFEEIIRKLPNSMVKGETTEEGRLSITCLDSSFSILTMDAEEFPSIGIVNEVCSASVKNTCLREMIRKTVFAASPDEKKGVLTGCLFNFSGNTVEAAALDGFRMAVACESTESDLSRKIILPARILTEISKIISECDDEIIKIVIDEKKAEISVGDTRITARLLEGEFIKYKDIIPTVYKTRCIVSREEMVSSIERASLLAKEGKNNLIKMSISSSSIEITSRSEEGSVREVVASETEGEDLVIGFNSKYVADVLKAVSDEEVAFEMSSSIGACIIRPVDGNAFTYLVLPVRISA